MSYKERNDHGQVGVKKPYVKPHIEIYGDIREITQTVGEMGAVDGGTGKASKTTT